MSLKGLKFACGLILLMGVIYFAGFNAVVSALSNITLTDAVILTIISFLMVAVSALKWQIFLKRQGNNTSFKKLFQLYLVGYFINIFMPSQIGGDVVRSLYLGKKGERHEALSATFLERYTGLVAMIIMATLSVIFASNVTIQIQIITLVIFAGMVIGSVILLNRSSLKIFEIAPFPKKWGDIFKKFQNSLIEGLRDPMTLQKAAFLSFVFHILTILNTVAVAHAVGWENPAILGLFVIVPIILLIGALPISPSGLGITEGAFFFFLKGIGATSEQAIGIPLVLRAKTYILAVVGGIVWMLMKKDLQKSRNS